MTKLKIKVTKEILERSKMCLMQSVSTNCAIAVAVRDIFPYCSVSPDTITITSIRPFVKIPLPYAARVFIVDFDGAKPHERPLLPEMEFEIEIPDEVIEQINIEEIKPLLENHPTLELITQ